MYEDLTRLLEFLSGDTNQSAEFSHREICNIAAVQLRLIMRRHGLVYEGPPVTDSILPAANN